MSRNPNWTLTEIEFLKANYKALGAEGVSAKLKRPLRATQVKASRLGFTSKNNIILWTEDELKFLKENFQRLNSYQLAAALGKKRSIVRMKYKELGLAKMELEYWTDEMVQFLKNHYKTTGDVELSEIFQQKFPRKKKWSKKHINKKRQGLNLHRTKKQVYALASQNSKAGGRSYTIQKNSASVTMADYWVAQSIIGPRSENAKEIIQELVKHPELIDAKRTNLKLKRKLKSL